MLQNLSKLYAIFAEVPDHLSIIVIHQTKPITNDYHHPKQFKDRTIYNREVSKMPLAVNNVVFFSLTLLSFVTISPDIAEMRTFLSMFF